MIEIGIDIGGTFTDVVCIQDRVRLHSVKVLSTRDVVSGVLDGVREVLAVAGVDPADAGRARLHVHGTTVATNALLEGTGAVTAVLATRGHEDALEIGRQKRSRMYDLDLDPETPVHLAPRRLRAGIPERIDGQGGIVEALDEAALLRAVEALVGDEGAQSLAVCYLNSYRNPVHELRTREVIGARFPGLSVSLSCEVSRIFREYERTCVTLFDAYVRPIVGEYLTRLGARLGQEGGRQGEDAHDLRIMLSRGAITSARLAAERPVSLLLSGPAGGVAGARHAALPSGFRDLVTFDTGGTSTDVALVRDGALTLTSEARFGGFPLQAPMLDIHTIGAGGGSIAWVDAGGLLRVGPRSAGSNPGPACYGRGGDRPTVTDASVVLGYIEPAAFAGGRVSLHPERADAVVGALARTLGLTREETALGIHRIANAAMVEAIKLVTVKRGFDPRRAALIAFGGAGPIHALPVARALGVRDCVVPAIPGALSAFGFLVSDVEFEGSRSLLAAVEGLDLLTLEALYGELEDEGHRTLREEGIGGVPIGVRRSADLRYLGQSYELTVLLAAPATAAALAEATASFHARHEEVYGHANPQRPVEIVNLRTVHVQALEPKPPGLLRARPGGGGPPGSRIVHFPGTSGPAPCWRGADIGEGFAVDGPAVIDREDAAILVFPGWRCRLDEAGNLLLRDDAPIEGA